MAAICALCTAAVLVLHFCSVPYLQSELNVRDLLVRFSKKARAPVDPRLVYLAIDDASINVGENAFQDDLAASPALQKMAAGWPWARDVHAMILERLVQAGASVVAFDLLFPTARDGDDALRKALEKYRSQVVLGGNFVDEQGSASTHAFSPPATSLVSDALDERVGFVNFWPDVTDDIVRESRFRLPASEIRHTPPAAHETIYESLGARVLRQIGLAPRIPSGAKVLRFAPEDGFQPQSVYLLFIKKAWETNFHNGAFFRDKIVVIGPRGNFLKDQLPTPFGLMDGPELHLNAINEALGGSFITVPGRNAEALLVAAAGLLALALSVWIPQPLLRFALLLAVSAGYIVALYFFYARGGVLGLVLSPLLAFDGSGFVALIWQQVLERVERARMRRTLERYVSKNVVKEILENPSSYLHALGGVRKCVVVLVSDLRNFTSISEEADTTQLVAQLNEYLTEMVKHVFENQGTLDKFIGDAILAVWGNVHSDGPARDAELAIETALRMQRSLAALNARWRADGQREFAMGIGLNFGEAIFGNIGSPEKMEPTVIGDPVNLASRLEGLTKEYGVELIIGESVAGHVRDKFHLQLADFVRVKGKSQPIKVYTVLGRREEKLDAETLAYLDEYENALVKYRAGQFSEACALFHDCLEKRPVDPLAKMYAGRCADLHRDPPGEKWEGVFVMKTK